MSQDEYGEDFVVDDDVYDTRLCHGAEKPLLGKHFFQLFKNVLEEVALDLLDLFSCPVLLTERSRSDQELGKTLSRRF